MLQVKNKAFQMQDSFELSLELPKITTRILQTNLYRQQCKSMGIVLNSAIWKSIIMGKKYSKVRQVLQDRFVELKILNYQEMNLLINKELRLFPMAKRDQHFRNRYNVKFQVNGLPVSRIFQLIAARKLRKTQQGVKLVVVIILDLAIPLLGFLSNSSIRVPK